MTDATPAQRLDADGPDDGARDAALVDLVVRGMVRGAVPAPLQAVVDQGWAMVKGPLVMPTPAGTAAAQALTRLPEGGATEQAVRAQYEAFLPVNSRLRDLCTAWQLRPDGSPNDHTDPAYDASVRDDLDDVDTAIGRTLRRLAEALPGLAHYRPDLTAALERFDDGDTGALTSPLSDSYHTVWMRLHQELLLLLGISRAEDERLETALVAGQKV